MQSTESRLTALENSLRRWRIATVLLALAAGVGAWIAARYVPQSSEPTAEIRLGKGAHTAVLTASGLTLSYAGASASITSDGLDIQANGNAVELGGSGLAVERGENAARVSPEGVTVAREDHVLVELGSEHPGRANLVLGDANGTDPLADLSIGGKAATLTLGRATDDVAAVFQLLPQGMALLCRTEPNKKSSCAELRDLSRAANGHE